MVLPTKSKGAGKDQCHLPCIPSQFLQAGLVCLTLLHSIALQAAALQRWRMYAAHCRRKAGRRRMARALALRHAWRRLHRCLAAWRRQAAAQARRRAAGAAAMQRVTKGSLRRSVSAWRLAALRQARPAC